MPKQKNEPIPVPSTAKAKGTSVIRILVSTLIGIGLGTILFMAFLHDKQDKCTDAMVTIQSFDVCLDKVQGCFFDAKDVLRVGRAIRYKKEHCD